MSEKKHPTTLQFTVPFFDCLTGRLDLDAACRRWPFLTPIRMIFEFGAVLEHHSQKGATSAPPTEPPTDQG